MPAFQIGEQVQTTIDDKPTGVLTIAGITPEGDYTGQSGLVWAAQDLRPLNGTAVLSQMTFQVDVSRSYRNKEGYEAGGYRLNMSFKTETHTPESFIEKVIKQGWPFTMVHQKRSPQETGAAARGVKTPKHTENFVSSQLLTGDDDSAAPGVVDWWLADAFFSRYGWLFVESVNSKPGAEKGHAMFLLDCPITDPELYRECLKALCYAYPRLDPLKNIDRTIYNAVGATVHEVGNICPLSVFEQEILQPYREAEQEKRLAIQAEQERRRAAYEQARDQGRSVSNDHAEAYLAGYLHWLFGKVAGTVKGKNRNRGIYWAGRCIAGIEATPWAQPYLHLLSDVEARIVDAAQANGYLAEYAGNEGKEVVRVFQRGRLKGGEPLEEPLPMPAHSEPANNQGSDGASHVPAVTPGIISPTTVLALDADWIQETTTGESEDDLMDMPALPEKAQMPAALAADACPWLDAYVAFSRRMSPRGYEDFHEAAGVWLLSTIAARRLVVQLGQKRFFPNLYIAFCALTTLFAKSTTAHIAHQILRESSLSYLLAPDEATPQAFLQLMASKLPDNLEEMTEEKQKLEKRRFAFRGQRGWYYDEFGMKVSALMRDNGVMVDFRGLLRVLDDGRDSFESVTIGRGHNRIEAPYLALLASLTPADIKPYAGRNAPLWRDGFWARFAFITPPPTQLPSFGRFPGDIETIPEDITAPLRAWHTRLGVPAVTVTPKADDAGKVKGYDVDCEPLLLHYMQLGEGVQDAFYAYHDALVEIAGTEQDSPNADLIGNYGRQAEKAMRIAMLLASVSGAARVEVKHWAKAQQIAERWRQNLHNLAAQVNAPQMSESANRQEKVLATARKLVEKGERITVRNLYQHLRKSLSVEEIGKVCKELVSAGLMAVQEEDRTTVYTLT